MFKVGRYTVTFKRHFHREPSHGRYDTVCTILVDGSERKAYAYLGVAKLHPKDQPDKVVGKKIALAHALAEKQFVSVRQFDKYARTEIWQAFWAWVESWKNDSKRDMVEKSPAV